MNDVQQVSIIHKSVVQVSFYMYRYLSRHEMTSNLCIERYTFKLVNILLYVLQPTIEVNVIWNRNMPTPDTTGPQPALSQIKTIIKALLW